MSKELREQFAEETNLNPLINPTFYYEWLESKLKDVEDSLMSDEEIDELYPTDDIHLWEENGARREGAKHQRERTKKAILK